MTNFLNKHTLACKTFSSTGHGRWMGNGDEWGSTVTYIGFGFENPANLGLHAIQPKCLFGVSLGSKRGGALIWELTVFFKKMLSVMHYSNSGFGINSRMIPSFAGTIQLTWRIGTENTDESAIIMVYTIPPQISKYVSTLFLNMK